jgi:hypothetical protein
MVYPALEVTIPVMLAVAMGVFWVVRSIERIGTKIDGFADTIRDHVTFEHGLIDARLEEQTRRIDSLHNGRYSNGA